MEKPTAQSRNMGDSGSLGRYLATIRLDRKLTLREVEERSERAVSNAYLSQIENEQIKKPSPNILYVLSDIYSINYERLMELAGYVSVSTPKPRKKQKHLGASLEEFNISTTERDMLVEYLMFLRSRKSLKP